MRRLCVGGRVVGDGQPCFIIAEIGQNHQGDVNVAKQLIDIAKDCGADCVKFQKSCLGEKFTKSVLNGAYESPHSWGPTYGEHKARLELSEASYLELQSYAKTREILFTASAMDPVSLEFLVSLKVPFIKIGSGDSSNTQLMEQAAASGIPLVISTGMVGLRGVKRASSAVRKCHDRLALLHCVSAYPTPPEEANLNAVLTLKREFPDLVIGYSGHEKGYNLTLAAVALGAKIVERHITLDKTWKGSDHRCSLTPSELKGMIAAVREIETALGSGVKALMSCELPCRAKLGKTVVASRQLGNGTILTLSDLKVKVAQNFGVSPSKLATLIGATLTADLSEDDVVLPEHVRKPEM